MTPERLDETEELKRLRQFEADITWILSRCTVLNSIIDPLIGVRDGKQYRDCARASAGRLVPFLEEIQKEQEREVAYVTCPNCYYHGRAEEFEVSTSDEAFCPKCNEEFLIDDDNEGDEEE